MAESVELTDNQKALMRYMTVFYVIERAHDLELQKVRLSLPQASVLYLLKTAKEPLTPMKLARMMHKQPHTVSALVHRMEAQGLVSTKRNLKRKNWLRVSLTKKGEEAVERWSTTTTVADTFSCLSKRESEAFYKTTQKLHIEALKVLRQMQPDPYAEPLSW
jgi:DNA-binding MarR family transcriptional regulator